MMVLKKKDEVFVKYLGRYGTFVKYNTEEDYALVKVLLSDHYVYIWTEVSNLAKDMNITHEQESSSFKKNNELINLLKDLYQRMLAMGYHKTQNIMIRTEEQIKKLQGGD